MKIKAVFTENGKKLTNDIKMNFFKKLVMRE